MKCRASPGPEDQCAYLWPFPVYIAQCGQISSCESPMVSLELTDWEEPNHGHHSGQWTVPAGLHPWRDGPERWSTSLRRATPLLKEFLHSKWGMSRLKYCFHCCYHFCSKSSQKDFRAEQFSPDFQFFCQSQSWQLQKQMKPFIRSKGF